MMTEEQQGTEAERALLATMKLDAKLWRTRQHGSEQLVGKDEVVAPHSASSIKRGPMPESERQKRAQAWDREKREAQRLRTAEHGRTSPGRNPASPAVIYIGEPCARCGGRERYIKSRQCRRCHIKAVQRAKQRRAA